MTRNRDRERRKEQRTPARDVRARVRPGHCLVVINLSASGALVEAGRPLRPGARIELHLENDDRRGLLKARIVRCTVAAIDAEAGVTYRAALSFDESSEWVRETLTRAGNRVPADAPLRSPLEGDSIPAGVMAAVPPPKELAK